MKGKFRNLKSIQKILLVVIFAIVLIPFFLNPSRENVEDSNASDNTTESTSQVQNNKNDSNKHQLQMIQSATQLALERNGLKNDTSDSLEDWNINSNEYNDTLRWNSVTHSNNNGRIKAIFEWNGKDDNDITLKYLLVKGNEIINDLKNK